MNSEKNSRTVDPNRRRLTINEQADQEFGLQGYSRITTSNTTTVKLEKENREIGSVYSDNNDESTPLPLFHSSTDSPETLPTKPEIESIPTELPSSSTFSEDRTTEINTNTTASGSLRKGNPELHSLRSRSASTNGSNQNQPKLRSELESMLARAANLIREAVSLSGISFFDPPIRVGRISNNGHSMERVDAEEAIKSTAALIGWERNDEALLEEIDQMDASATASTVPKEKACKVLASSTRVGPNRGNPSIISLHLPERILHRIVEKFPQGGILEYDDNGPVSCGELELAWYQNIPKAREFFVSSRVVQAYSADSDGDDSVEAHYLWRMLPGVRSIILFPLWDSSRDRLFAYNIAWTTDKHRVFQREDFAYLASFCNSITSELSRLDTLAADQAKANFISSISHELRSPPVCLRVQNCSRH
jgi:hypothetical protein